MISTSLELIAGTQNFLPKAKPCSSIDYKFRFLKELCRQLSAISELMREASGISHSREYGGESIVLGNGILISTSSELVAKKTCVPSPKPCR